MSDWKTTYIIEFTQFLVCCRDRCGSRKLGWTETPIDISVLWKASNAIESENLHNRFVCKFGRMLDCLGSLKTCLLLLGSKATKFVVSKLTSSAIPELDCWFCCVEVNSDNGVLFVRWRFACISFTIGNLRALSLLAESNMKLLSMFSI